MMKNELVANLHNVEGNAKALASDAEGLLREISSATVETLVLARSKIEEELDNAKSSVKSARVSITEKAHDAADNVYGYVAENPWKVFGVATVAAVAGVIVGVVLNRR